MNFLDQDGFVVIKNLIPKEAIESCTYHIKDAINQASAELKVDVADYLHATGRWATKSPITRIAANIVDQDIEARLAELCSSKIIQKKSNVICKTADLVDAIPFHQDISYSRRDPYHFSVWLALNDVDKNSGALQVIKNSHTLPIEPAADFWSPYFSDKSNQEKGKAQSIEVSAGDAIIFDSRLWHGSNKNFAGKDRFAYVTRWSIPGKGYPDIPEIVAEKFGMFNCGHMTDEILQKSLLLYEKQPPEYELPTKEKLVDKWIDILQKKGDVLNKVGALNEGSSLNIDSSLAIQHLKSLRVLHLAHDAHDAGNISGEVYKNLWFSLLSPLGKKIQLLKI
ncbi:MAG: phytanoyl-CoA dioxygenase [Rickettsiales bacterium]|nr:MAG: phytanoyl-CoA dioxygenase [Rickettsiales bacterium]